MSGKVVHFEVPADDLERAQEFYRQAFGWTLNGMPELDYVLAVTSPVDEQGMPTEPGAINGGMFKRDPTVNQPVITIDVDDMDRALELIPTLGGKVVRGKDPVADMGFAAYFTDTEGNLMGLWQTAR